MGRTLRARSCEPKGPLFRFTPYRFPPYRSPWFRSPSYRACPYTSYSLAIALGFIVIACLAFGTDAIIRTTAPQYFGVGGRVDDVGLLLFSQLYTFIYATFGCWLAARLAPSRPMRHALILGALGLAFNIAGTIVMWHTAPAWYSIMALALVMPTAWLGGWFRERQLARGAPAGGLAAA